MQQTVRDIEQWAKDRKIDKEGSLDGQSLKTCEELAELIIAINKDDRELIKDGIGDVFVTLVVGNLLKDYEPMTAICAMQEEFYQKFTASEVPKQGQEKKIEQIKDLSQLLYLSIREPMYFNRALNGAIAILIEIARSYGLTLHYCACCAYNEIKDRKGKMVDGSFVKER